MSRNSYFVYLEQDRSEVDGPFSELEEMFDSPLWFRRRACFWRERYVLGRGWIYEHAKRTEGGWCVTSSGVRPIAPFRPQCLLAAARVSVPQGSLGYERSLLCHRSDRVDWTSAEFRGAQ